MYNGHKTAVVTVAVARNYHTSKTVNCTPDKTENAQDETMPRYYADVQLKHNASNY